MILLKDGVKYFLHSYDSEEELKGMVIEHYKEVFGSDSIYFDFEPKLRSRAGIGSKPDGCVIVLRPELHWIILETELSKHPLYEHIIPQISKFNKALENPDNRAKIVDAMHDMVNKDYSKRLLLEKSGIVKEVYKFLSKVVSKKPDIAIIIDEKTEELEEVLGMLPFKPEVVEFRTFKREGVGLGVHIHLFEPLYIEEVAEKVEEEIIIRPAKREYRIIPREEYRIPILEALMEMGGKGRTKEVIEKVGEKMRGKLTQADYEKLPSGMMVRWKNRAQWERFSMVEDGLLKSGSPRGIWEITDKGREFYRRGLSKGSTI